MEERNLSRHLTAYKESSGPPTAGSRPGEKISSGPQARDDRLEIFTLNIKYWLSVAEWLALGLKGFICTVDNYTTEKDKNTCNITGPRAPIICTALPSPRPHFVSSALSVTFQKAGRLIVHLLRYAYRRRVTAEEQVIRTNENALNYIVSVTPVFLNRRAAARYRALASIIPGRERQILHWIILYIFGDQNGMCQWKSAHINLMMLAWGNYKMIRDFIGPVIDN
jgi:hypothetical protein